ncbi:MAG: hypothetical protein U1E87_10620 [Alphaproteobacteria bacterium]
MFVESRRVSLILLAGFLTLLAGHIAALVLWFGFGHDSCLGFVPFFNFDEEANAPAWYSSFLLLLGAAVSALAAVHCASGRRELVKYWLFLAFAFVFLSFDETAQVHELLGRVQKYVLHSSIAGVSSFNWTVTYAALVLVFGLAYLNFLMKLQRAIALLLVGSGALYVAGALGMEVVAATIAQIYRAAHPASGNAFMVTQPYLLEVTIEETMEFLAEILFVYAVLKYLEVSGAKIEFTFGRS